MLMTCSLKEHNKYDYGPIYEDHSGDAYIQMLHKVGLYLFDSFYLNIRHLYHDVFLHPILLYATCVLSRPLL